jgi:hypothetical protein
MRKKKGNPTGYGGIPFFLSLCCPLTEIYALVPKGIKKIQKRSPHDRKLLDKFLS